MIDLKEILEKMNLNQKINYDKVMMKMVQNWQTAGIRPKILLHACCAPCSTTTLERMTEFAEVTIYYANSNIHPRAEYQRREYVQQKFIHDFNEKTGNHVQFIAAPYRPQEYFEAVRGLEKEPEGGKRCQICFWLRLNETARVAASEDFDYFSTTLTISPLKNAETLNMIGQEMAEKWKVAFLPSDFKKKNGYKRSIELSKEHDLYRQDYCGCIFSKIERTKQMSEGGNN